MKNIGAVAGMSMLVMSILYIILACAAPVLTNAHTYKIDFSWNSLYNFTNNRILGFIIELWCFVFTAFACIMGMFPKDVVTYSSGWYFQITLNILTPFIFIGLGFILPIIANRLNKKENVKIEK